MLSFHSKRAILAETAYAFQHGALEQVVFSRKQNVLDFRLFAAFCTV